MKKLRFLSLSVFILSCITTQSFAKSSADQVLTGGITFGTSISISGDLAVVSAGWENTDLANKAGAVYVYEFTGIEWVEKQKIVNPEGSYDAIFGQSVSTNGEYIVVTEPNRQSAHIYKYSGDMWVQDTIFTVTDVTSEKYGISCAIDGSTIVIGSGSAFAGFCTGVGSAYVYSLNGSEWEYETILKPSDPKAHDGFATGVEVEGDMIVIGAPRSHCYAGAEGYVCTFEYQDSDWVETSKIFSPETTAGDAFGRYIALDNGNLIVSSPYKASIYCYSYNNGWQYVETLTTPNPDGGDGFGQPVSASENRLIVGASSDDSEFDNQGAVYLYQFDGTNWNLNEMFVPEEPVKDLKFGFNLCIGSHNALISVYNGEHVNAFYLSDPPGSCIDTILVHDTIFVTILDTVITEVIDSISVTDTLVIDAILTGQDSQENLNTLKVYPNPAKNHIYINTGDYNRMTGYQLRIINQNGAVVFETIVESPLYEVNLSDWTGLGLYNIIVIDPGGSPIETRKIILQ